MRHYNKDIRNIRPKGQKPYYCLYKNNKFVMSIGKDPSEYLASIGDVKELVSILRDKPDLSSNINIKRILNEVKRQQERIDDKLSLPNIEPIPVGPFKAISIDPPWDWGDENDADQFGRARPVYETMTFDEIKALPVISRADKNCHLYLWITNRSLPKGFELLDAWGFRYITLLTWGKPHFGMGNYFRGQTEQILFGVKGSLPLLRHDVGTIFLFPRGNSHSSKPDRIFDILATCSPEPRLEMFARKEHEGWESWGNINHG